ncbi:hypothetical protein SAMN05216277_102163 [Halolamina pelagica]|uniref:Uncharacterized protein n=1 Tax=Halolamina pelagica TaxID=699431 RepID=A0A1I5NS24_9EURY|nr:hypothetical protein SAMN05216277_102163 [Halolamina pelagica]
MRCPMLVNIVSRTPGKQGKRGLKPPYLRAMD